ncbi:hypothetical protein F2P81_017050 [Scophthalmus maximus]|uniref:Uncharacterized protein n=1 Tax=Scophthalmus maximus TaxID=52904 RepID=A0A6A4SCK6_SCOMX|nr:hypothetical protein F2P81_017050 [Scophthalmus maximus]
MSHEKAKRCVVFNIIKIKCYRKVQSNMVFTEKWTEVYGVCGQQGVGVGGLKGERSRGRCETREGGCTPAGDGQHGYCSGSSTNASSVPPSSVSRRSAIFPAARTIPEIRY